MADRVKAKSKIREDEILTVEMSPGSDASFSQNLKARSDFEVC